jgi:hypothetical protein
VTRSTTVTAMSYRPALPAAGTVLDRIGCYSFDQWMVHLPVRVSGWFSDYPSGSGYFPPEFSFTPYGPPEKRGFSIRRTPSIDARIGHCLQEIGRDQAPSWADLDRHVMEEIVPWAPIAFARAITIVSPRVAGHSFDQSRTAPPLDRIALNPAAIAEDSA